MEAKRLDNACRFFLQNPCFIAEGVGRKKLAGGFEGHDLLIAFLNIGE